MFLRKQSKHQVGKVLQMSACDYSCTSFQIMQAKLIWLLLDHTLRGVLWFTQVIIAELFNFIHIERQHYKSLTEKYLKKLTKMDLITYRILLQQMH